jgi:hypothetical protein
MDTCKTCRFWEADPPADGGPPVWGICALIRLTPDGYDTPNYAKLTDNSRLATHKDFGCTEHQDND